MKTPKTYKSVWDAIEDNPVEAANLKLRSQLMMEISAFVNESGLTQTDAAKQMGTTQPRLNDVIKGRIEKCTVDRLVNMLSAVGYKVHIDVSHAA